MTKSQSDLPEELICSTKTLPPQSIPSWGMYLISAVCILFAGPFVLLTISALMSPLRGAIQAATVGLVISLIFLACGAAAFVSGRKTSKARKVCFHSDGVVIETGNEEIFVPYAEVDGITIELIEPSGTTNGKAMARAALSLAAGIGHAIGKSLSTGIVHVKLPNEKNPFTFQFDLLTTRQLAEKVSIMCEHAVIHQHS